MKIFYSKEVFEFLSGISKIDRSRLDRVRDLFSNYDFQVGPKYIKKIRENLWELRAGKIRVFLWIEKGVAYAVHAIYKKSQQLLKSDIKLAIKRSKSI